ncbi:hypothetical protein RND81_12G149900 [Saponaria officinalis]|uniref:Uncharacterized protein n=1 Tax=Saponaria officinalis TaxID=3572 RepID=A0AAW1HAP5_SAPOF
MEDISFIIGIIGNIISALLFLSPAKTFVRIVRNRSTEEFESFPYVATLLSSSIWTYYGIIKPGAILVSTVNGFGALVQLVYVSLFLFFAPPSKMATTAMFVGVVDVGCLGAILSISWFFLNVDMRITVIGLIGAALNIVMYGSPLAALVPNAIGFILGAVQLTVYAKYRTTSDDKQHNEPLIGSSIP